MWFGELEGSDLGLFDTVIFGLDVSFDGTL